MIGWWVNVFWTEILLICLQKYIKIYIPVFRTMKMTWLHFAKSCITLLLRMVLIVIVLLVSMRCVLPILLYGPETWTLIQADWNKLDSFHVRCQRRILHIRLRIQRWSPASYRPVWRLVHRSQATTGPLWSRRQTPTRCTSKPDPKNLPQDEGW